MKIIYKSKINGCYLIEHPIFDDERGNFSKVFSSFFKKKFLNNKQIKQINVSSNKKKYSLRGLHYQNPKPEYKLVKCLEGEIFDTVIDVRRGSVSFLKKEYFVLKSGLPQFLLIPENCAHGYLTLKSNSKILYMHTNDYYEKYSKGFHYLDPLFNIKWPYKPTCISKKDASFSFIDQKNFDGIK